MKKNLLIFSLAISLALVAIPGFGQTKNLNLKLYLEALFNGTNMNKAQGDAGDQFSGTIADKITVELYNSDAPCILAGGPYIVDLNTDGSAVFLIPASLNASYFIAVKHRNSIETWSKNPVSFAGGNISYDFSTATTQAMGNNLKFMAGKYVIFGGDVNQDGIVDSGDWSLVENDVQNYVSGYVATDDNGDGLVDSGDYTIIDNNTNLYVGKETPQCATLNLTLFFEGLFNGASMNKAQGNSGDQFPGTVADQFNVELHNAIAPYELAAGPVVAELNTNGTATVNIAVSQIASYYIVIKHRNGIETWSGAPVSFSGTPVNYNFSISEAQAYGNNLKLMSGKYVIFTGDIDQDGIIDSSDWSLLENDVENFIMGYVNSDLNGDGVVDSGDYSILENNTNNFISKKTP
jgi:hypothetical protein